MERTAKNKSMEFDTKGLRQLLQSFFNDPFVIRHCLQELSLEEIGSFFEQLPEENQEDPGTTSESVGTAKSHYCLILMELELLSYSSAPDGPVMEFYNQLGNTESLELSNIATLPDIPASNSEIAFEDFVMPGGEKLESSGAKEFSKEVSWRGILNSFQSDSGKAYYELGRTMDFPGSFPRSIRSEDLERLHCLCQIWSLECELYKRLSSSLAEFWGQRDTYISKIIFQNGHAYDFHPSLKEGIDSFAKSHPDWLYEQRFPVAGLMSSLRYILSVTSYDRFVPAAIDFACFLMLFGRNAQYGPQLIQNVLGIQGISNEEALETAARLSRIQRLKAKILNPHQKLLRDVVESINQDVAALIPIMAKLKTQQIAKEVA